MLPALLHEIVFIEGAAIPARQAAAPFLYDLTQEEQSKSQVETAAVSVAVEEEAGRATPTLTSTIPAHDGGVEEDVGSRGEAQKGGSGALEAR